MEAIKSKIYKFYQNPEWITSILEKIVYIVLVILLATIAIKISFKLIDYVMNIQTKNRFKLKVNEKKSETLHKLINSFVKYGIYFIAFFQILSILGINTTSIIASAGIASVAIGFGAQSLVKDLISGFFIVLEGQFDVGDYVKVYNQGSFIAEGNVLSLGVRSTKIKSKEGEVYFVPNGTINQVINFSLTYSLAKVELPIFINGNIESFIEEVNNLLIKLNEETIYKQYFYKKEELHLEKIDKIENNIAYITLIGKIKLGKKSIVETMIRKDFYDLFKERITSGEDSGSK